MTTRSEYSSSASAPTTRDETIDATPVGHFYRVIWRWHFYAGLLVIPFLLMLATTGIIYLFKPQLDALMYPQHVTPVGALLPATDQLTAVEAAYPGAEISTVRPSLAPDRSAEFVLTTADERDLTVFVSPYSGDILGERDDNNNLQEWAVTLHGELMIGTTGDILIELAACWALVLVSTGLYLWWPRKAAAIWGTLLPRLKSTNRRIFWRDLHAVPGFWGALLIVFMIMTGLPWAGLWGDNFAQVWNRYPAQLWNDVPTSNQLAGTLNERGKVVPWAVEQTPLPVSYSARHEGHGDNDGPAAADGTVSLDSVIALAAQTGMPAGYSVSLPSGAEGVYTVSSSPPDPADQVTMHIDQYSGDILADIRWAEYGIVPKSVEMGIALHMGTYAGLLNQLVMLCVCLIIITLSITGAVMWWQRRPEGRLGAPEMPRNFPLWKGAVAILIALSIVFPLVGASLVVMLLFDYLLVRRVPALQRALN